MSLQERNATDKVVEARERYVAKVPANARLVALAKEWLGIDVQPNGAPLHP